MKGTYIVLTSETDPAWDHRFYWPEGEPLLLPREGDMAHIPGSEPKRVETVVYTYEVNEWLLERVGIHIRAT